MIINKDMWSKVIDKNYDKDGVIIKEIFKITTEAKIKYCDGLEKTYLKSGQVNNLAEHLGLIDLESNKKLKELFFNAWKGCRPSNKLQVFAQQKIQGIVTIDSMNYFLENMIKNPTVTELDYFKEELGHNGLRKGLINLFEKIVTNEGGTKKDYWENHVSYENIEMLIKPIEEFINDQKDLTKLNKLGFRDKFIQARFDRKLATEKSRNLFEHTQQNVILMTVDINPVALLNVENVAPRILKAATHFISSLIMEAMKLDVLATQDTKLKMAAYSDEQRDEALLNQNAIMMWAQNNPREILERAEVITKKNPNIYSPINLKGDADVIALAQKIVMNANLESKLERGIAPTRRKPPKI